MLRSSWEISIVWEGFLDSQAAQEQKNFAVPLQLCEINYLLFCFEFRN